jgi:hypothetical protein
MEQHTHTQKGEEFKSSQGRSWFQKPLLFSRKEKEKREMEKNDE